jgi:heme oxygenase
VPKEMLADITHSTTARGASLAHVGDSLDNTRVDLERLRTETRAEHEAVEALMPLMSPTLTKAQYADVLESMHRLVHGWESWGAEHVPETLAAVFKERRREALIHADVLALGRIADHEALAHPTFAVEFPDREQNAAAFEAAFLGAMYVMEGSRLGGQHIAKYVEDKLGLATGVGDAYFRGFGQRTGVMWQEFKARLQLVPDEYTAVVIAAAKAMFHYFAEGVRACSEAGH